MFFVWGFAYGLIGTLNARVQDIHGFSSSQTFALSCAYWIAYFVAPALVAYWVITRQGFKATFITGLALSSVGLMAFWPSAVLGSYAGFFISNFFVALGLSTIEVAANPFIALAGPGQHSEARLNFSQSIQAIGGLISPIIASKILFDELKADESRLFKVQWCYLAVAMFVLFTAVLFFYVPLSEASDEDLEKSKEERMLRAEMPSNPRYCGMPMRIWAFGLGIVMMWFYIGAQEILNYYWPTLSVIIRPSFDDLWGETLARAVFVVGRFAAAVLCYIGIPPRYVLAGFTVGAFITTITTIVLPISKGTYASLILMEFFESPIFPTIFAIAIRNQGRHTKLTSTMLMMAANGGAVWPAVAYVINRRHDDHSRLLLVPAAVLFGLNSAYPVFLSSAKTYRRWVDPRWSKRKPLLEKGVREEDAGHGASYPDGDIGDLGLSPRQRTEELRLGSEGAFLSAPLTVGLGLNLPEQEEQHPSGPEGSNEKETVAG